MTKNLKSNEVIEIIQKKVLLKKQLKEFKSSGDDKKAEVVSLKINQYGKKIKILF